MNDVAAKTARLKNAPAAGDTGKVLGRSKVLASGDFAVAYSPIAPKGGFPEQTSQAPEVYEGVLRGVHKPLTSRGWILGTTISSSVELIRRIESGFPFGMLEQLAWHTGMREEEVARLADIAPRTLARRRTEGRLDERESERLWRLASLVEKGIDMFEGSIPEALAWLQVPQKALEGAAPLAFARTEPGAREVENLIGRLEHGVFS